MKYKRLTIITDSLGMPREREGIENTWVELLQVHLAQKDSGGGVIVYFFPQRGRHTRDLLAHKEDLLLHQASDIVIIQVGVVDSCRRLIKRGWGNIIESIPFIRSVYKSISSRLMYPLTRLYNFHYVSPKAFENNILTICEAIYQANPKARILWLKIAPAGASLTRKVYAIREDIALYNEILERCAKARGFEVLDPYATSEASSITIRDGHHLSIYGHQLVYQTIKEKLCNERF